MNSHLSNPDAENIVGSITFLYHYGSETISYVDPEKLVKDYKEAISELGPNGASVSILNNDIELGLKVFSLKVDEYGEEVNEDLYRELATKHGIGSPETSAAIIDQEQRMEEWKAKQMLLPQNETWEEEYEFEP